MQKILSMIAAATLLSGGTAIFAQPGDAPVQVEIDSPEIELETGGVLSADRILLNLADYEPQNVTFLGISTGEVPQVLRHHLKLSGAAGLMVEHIVPDSPAEKAGLKRYDVIEKLGDQLLVNAEQLATLVRSKRPGEEIELTVHREGKPITVTATLDEQQVPQPWLRLHSLRNDALERVQEVAERLRQLQIEQPGEQNVESRERIEALTDELLKRLKELREEGAAGVRMRVFPGPGGPQPWKNRGEALPQPPRAPGAPGAPGAPRGPRGPGTPGPGGAGAVASGEFHGARIDAQSITVRSSDPQHIVQLQVESGQKTLKVTEADNEDAVVFEGPINTAEEREQIPAELRPKLTRLEQALDQARGPRHSPGMRPGMGPGMSPGGPPRPRAQDDDHGHRPPPPPPRPGERDDREPRRDERR